MKKEMKKGEKDPVCGMSVDPRKTRHSLEHDGRRRYFCGADCMEKFRSDPAKYSGMEARAGSGGEE
ncbi:MAG: YHS domain-containing protein [Elusimicrobia bacterium]|nr:YHS domain-containing protein [Elusimicrobiota bacterium]